MKTLRLLAICSTFIFLASFSCEEKDEVNCTTLQVKFASLTAQILSIQGDFNPPDYTDGLDQAECTEYSGWITAWSGKIEELIALAKKGRSCPFVKDFVKDEGYTEDQLDQYISDREEEILSLKDDLASNCN